MKKRIVTHSNDLVYAEFDNFEMRELKLMLTLISTVTDDKPYFYDAKEIKKLVGMGTQTYEKFEVLIQELQGKILKVEVAEKKYRTYNIFSVLEFDTGDKTIQIEYNTKFIPFILNFNNNFTRYSLENIENLNSKNAMLLYIRARANLFRYGFRITVEEFKSKFGNNYRVADIDRKVVGPALTAINNLTDVKISVEKEYGAQERGRSRVIAYIFKVSKKKKILSSDLYKAMEKANKNRYIKESKVLNYDTIEILSEEYSEKVLIKGLLKAYEEIKVKFEALNYLKAIINTITVEPEIVYSEKTKQKNIKAIDKNILIPLNKNIETVDTILDDNPIDEKLEEELCKKLIATQNITMEFLQNMKRKSPKIYTRTLMSVK